MHSIVFSGRRGNFYDTVDRVKLINWGMFHLCSKKDHRNSDRMTKFLQDRMVKKNLWFRLINVDFGRMLAHTLNTEVEL
jgi:hypothetical protein